MTQAAYDALIQAAVDRIDRSEDVDRRTRAEAETDAWAARQPFMADYMAKRGGGA